MSGWKIGPPALSKEERKEIAVAERAAQSRKKNKAARKARRINRK